MTSRVALFWMAIVWALAPQALAYEVDTHQVLSEEGALQSRLSEYLPVLGLKSLQDPLTDISETKALVDWIRAGAHDEDDTISTNFLRYRHHFFDTQHGGRGLVVGAVRGEPSPDWALEDTRTFVTQSYSFKEARQYFYDALTLQDNREQWMARTFYTLGHVIHHIQDMAQPQHTRNDPHGGVAGFGDKSRYEIHIDEHRDELTFADQYYNADDPVHFDSARKFWITGDGRGMAEFSSHNFVSFGTNFRGALQGGILVAQPNESYPIPAPDPVAPVFEDANALLASVGKPVSPECSTDPCEMAFYSSEVTDSYRLGAGKTNSRASTASIFDQDLERYRKTVPYPNLDRCSKPGNTDTCEQIRTNRIFSLNRFNFDAASEFLIPRAVAYSAGLIDHFFRGRLEAEDVEYTDTGIRLRVKNAIDPDETPAWKDEILYAQAASGSAGTFVVAFEYEDGSDEKRYGVSAPVAANGDLAPGKTSSDNYEFAVSIPDDAREVKFRLVFRGKLGQEGDAVAVGAVEPPVSGFLVRPSYTPTDGISGPRLIYRSGGQWKLDGRRNLSTGNIDWKGWYRNGRATRVLSWRGPQARYFPDSTGTPMGKEVYEKGEILARAPSNVLGAAIMRDTEGTEWLVVIASEGFAEGHEDVVYRRLYAKHDPPDPREQWVEIGRFNVQDRTGSAATVFEADRPWFFNGRGDEAQTLRRWRNVEDPRYKIQSKRLKIRINSSVTEAALQDLGNLPGYKSEHTCSAQKTDDRGSGRISTTFTRTGSYIIAVDYKNNTEVLAKVRLDARTVEDYDVQFEPKLLASLSRDYRWIEHFEWGGASLVHFASITKLSASWDGHSSSLTTDQTGQYKWKQYLQGLDLREDIYAYTYWETITQNAIDGGNDTRSGEWREGGDMIVGGSQVNIYGPLLFPTDTSSIRPSIREVRECRTQEPNTRYGELDFSIPQGGALAVDTNDNIAASFVYRIEYDGTLQEPFNYLSNGSLTELLPGARRNPRYPTIGVAQ